MEQSSPSRRPARPDAGAGRRWTKAGCCTRRPSSCGSSPTPSCSAGASRSRGGRSGRARMAPEVFFADVSPGDYVVHIEHGIGRFQGLIKMTLDGIEREYLQVEYAQGDQLYVPVHQADRLARYVGAGEGTPGAAPAGHGGVGAGQGAREEGRGRDRRRAAGAVRRARGRAGPRLQPRRAVAARAGGQLPLRRDRGPAGRHRGGQARHGAAAADGSPDLRRRGLRQDRGGAARGLQGGHGRQAGGRAGADHRPGAAALHHLHAAGWRPSRSRSRCSRASRRPPEQDRIIAGLANGSVDIVIGTHRLLSKDVAFKDLGLLIIDEEQRFGVAHKERLKQMRTEVDVLTLTATPIPRTLHMSLTGVRDLSTIDTPPEERLPDRDVRGRVRRDAGAPGDPARAGPRRAGLLRAQPGAGHRADRGAARQDRAGGARRHRPRPDAGARAGSGDAGLRRGRVRRAGLHHHHRERAGHPQRQHHHHRPGRPRSAWRSSTSCAAAWAGGACAPTPICWSTSTRR